MAMSTNYEAPHYVVLSNLLSGGTEEGNEKHQAG
jgi:hypothetical protein